MTFCFRVRSMTGFPPSSPQVHLLEEVIAPFVDDDLSGLSGVFRHHLDVLPDEVNRSRLKILGVLAALWAGHDQNPLVNGGVKTGHVAVQKCAGLAG
jgi:hypothetical protein